MVAMFKNIHLQSLSSSFRVSVQSLGGNFASLCWGFDFYEVKKGKKLTLIETFFWIFFHNLCLQQA